MSLDVVDGARPVVLEQAGHRAVGQNAAARLAARAVVRLVVGVADPLDGRAADRTRLPEAAVHPTPELHAHVPVDIAAIPVQVPAASMHAPALPDAVPAPVHALPPVPEAPRPALPPIPSIDLSLPADGTLEMIETRHRPAEASPQEPEPPRPRRVRPPRVR